MTGLDLILPFNIDEATYLMPLPDAVPMSDMDLAARQGRELSKRLTVIEAVRDHVYEARKKHMHRFVVENQAKIVDYNFRTGSLVLMQNTRYVKSIGNKLKPRYLGPFIVVSRNKGGAYILADLNGAVLD